MGSFSIKRGDVDKITKNLVAMSTVVDRNLEKKMNLIVDVVYKTAIARRPKVAVTKENRGQYRVSDPNARLGVPVDTGALQLSIKKNMHSKGGKVSGTIDAGEGLSYANAIEFGTSKMQARPFMRPAFNENKEWIIRKFKEPIENLK